MKISGILTIDNAISSGYPFIEAALSVLPITDEFLINDGGSSDKTAYYLRKLKKTFPKKIKIFNKPYHPSDYWETIDECVEFLISKAKGDWIFEVQGDEIWHERDLIPLRKIIKSTHKKKYNSIRQRRLDCTFTLLKKDYTYANVRIVRNIPNLKSYWGGDDFQIGRPGAPKAGYTSHNVPPELKIKIPYYHFTRLFPRNILRVEEKIALKIASKQKERIALWEKHKKIPWDSMKPPLPEQILDCLPGLIKGLSQELEYKVREELFDKKWLKKITGLKYL